MKNADYWKERFAQLEAAQHKKDEATYREIERQYREAQREIEGKINTWYQRLANNNGITMAEARKLLKGNELKEFRWDINDYIKYGEENAVNHKWLKELENASAKFHISKLEALKMQTRQSLEIMYAKQLGTITNAMNEAVKSSYYHTAFEVQKGVGIGWNIAGLDQRKIEKVVMKPWAVDGKNFSERIWVNKERLINEVHNELTRNIITGADPQKAINNIAKKLNTSKYNAGRLIMTESAALSSAAQMECYSELGVEEVEFVASLDEATCEMCGPMDGVHFPKDKAELGGNLPPLHPNCRCCTVPYFNDEFTKKLKRIARDENGKAYYVPYDMDFEEWKKKFVDKSERNGIIKANKVNNYSTIKNGKMNIVNDREYWKNSSFSSEKKLNRHLQAHLSEYIGYTADDYIIRARNLLSADLNDYIDGFVDKDGFVFKYDKINNDFVIGRPDGCISTLFKPKDKGEYWKEQKKYYKEGEDSE